MSALFSRILFYLFAVTDDDENFLTEWAKRMESSFWEYASRYVCLSLLVMGHSFQATMKKLNRRRISYFLMQNS